MTEEQIATLCHDIQRGWNTQRWLSVSRQARIAKSIQVLEKAHIEGVGQHEMSVDPYAFHSWGQKLGYSCWSDPEFRREFARDNPAVKVTVPRRRNKVGYGD